MKIYENEMWMVIQMLCPQKAEGTSVPHSINEPHLQLLADGIKGVPFVHESTQQVGDLRNKNSGC